MTSITASKKTLQLTAVASLTIGAPLEGGTYCGIVTQPDGAQLAVALLSDKPPKRLNHADAQIWAESVDGVLPTRLISALLFANAKDQFEPEWHWTSERYGASYAWDCNFDDGIQLFNVTGASGAARAVRMIPLVL